MPMTEDFSVFFNPNEHATEALFGPGAESVNGNFQDEWVETDGPLPYHVSSQHPTFLCPEAAVADYERDALVVIGSDTYKIKDKHPDGTGLTLIELKRG